MAQEKREFSSQSQQNKKNACEVAELGTTEEVKVVMTMRSGEYESNMEKSNEYYHALL